MTHRPALGPHDALLIALAARGHHRHLGPLLRAHPHAVLAGAYDALRLPGHPYPQATVERLHYRLLVAETLSREDLQLCDALTEARRHKGTGATQALHVAPALARHPGTPSPDPDLAAALTAARDAFGLPTPLQSPGP